MSDGPAHLLETRSISKYYGNVVALRRSRRTSMRAR